MNMATHSDYMKQALNLAEQGRFTVSPNPMVGCVIVKNNLVIGEGYHLRAGEAHAEINALRNAGAEARDATMYVTLEPCCHYGRTPPCTDAIIAAGIRKIYIACLDPNPLVQGKGIAALQAAGIEIETGMHESAAVKQNEVFFHFIRHKRPFIIAKWAMSLDGKTVTHPDDSADISCAESRHFSHQIRQQVDAILIGANTAVTDNPLLTVRHGTIIKQPQRIILSSHGDIPLDLNLFNPALPAAAILVVTDRIDSLAREKLRASNITYVVTPANQYGRVDLHALLAELGKRDITSILVEGGMTVVENFFEENLVNQVQVYLAPVIIGAMKKKHRLENVTISGIAHDYYFSGEI
jgi:diaminohydroxyphosphoribosylaminopyrimidine deaminase/5-amino-6-(5-phosphoribosylamino)uracil reductase